jgi:hypothetical protein
MMCLAQGNINHGNQFGGVYQGCPNLGKSAIRLDAQLSHGKEVT